jgi:histidinol-phosphate aminotransferase
MSAQLASYLFTIKSPYNVSVAAESAMLASLDDTDILLQRVRDLVEERERMSHALKQIPGIHCFPSKGNFILCRFPDNMSASIYTALTTRGIFVRKFSSSQTSNCLRISIGKDYQNDTVVNAISSIMGVVVNE